MSINIKSNANNVKKNMRLFIVPNAKAIAESKILLMECVINVYVSIA